MGRASGDEGAPRAAHQAQLEGIRSLPMTSGVRMDFKCEQNRQTSAWQSFKSHCVTPQGLSGKASNGAAPMDRRHDRTRLRGCQALGLGPASYCSTAQPVLNHTASG